MRRLLNSIASIALALIILLPFQNCSSNEVGFSGDAETVQSSGGQPYQGKIFALAGDCADGTRVKSRIYVRNLKSATLLRDNCQNILPVSLPEDAFQFDPIKPMELVYNNATYREEQSAVPFRPAYMQWNNPLRNISAPVLYQLDGLEYSAAEIQQLKTHGHTVICVITAGVAKPTDPDYAQFSPSDLGNIADAGGIRWVDTRSANVRSIMVQRLNSVVGKGCDGAAWDQTDAQTANSGFPLTNQTEADFATFLASETHNRGLQVVLWNSHDIADLVAPFFDAAYTESSLSNGNYNRFQSFLKLGKPVMASSSEAYSAATCNQLAAAAVSLFFTSQYRDGSRYEPCPLP